MQIYNGDCLKVMDQLVKKGIKVDLVLTDLPYGTTKCKWDNIIPFDEMWNRINKITSDRTPVVLFGCEPFSSMLRNSNIKFFKYDWVWQKEKGSGFLNAKKQPLREHELISVFYKKQCSYNPQMKIGKPYTTINNPTKAKGLHSDYKTVKTENTGGRYPTSILMHKKEVGLHPTQKPVELLEYLIKTYTNEGDTVLDFTMGSGSTGVACQNLNRHFIGIELDKKYFEIAKKRLNTNLEKKGEKHEVI